VWFNNLPLEGSPFKINFIQGYFLKISNPFLKPEMVKEETEKHVIFNELATGMPVEVVREQFQKMGINYDELKFSKPISRT